MVLRGEVSMDFILTGHRVHSATLLGNGLHRQRPGFVTAALATRNDNGEPAGAWNCALLSARLLGCSAHRHEAQGGSDEAGGQSGSGRIGPGESGACAWLSPRTLRAALCHAGPCPGPANSRRAPAHAHGVYGGWAWWDSHPLCPPLLGALGHKPWEGKAWRQRGMAQLP